MKIKRAERARGDDASLVEHDLGPRLLQILRVDVQPCLLQDPAVLELVNHKGVLGPEFPVDLRSFGGSERGTPGFRLLVVAAFEKRNLEFLSLARRLISDGKHENDLSVLGLIQSEWLTSVRKHQLV